MEAATQFNASRVLTPQRRAWIGSALFHLILLLLMLFMPRVWERKAEKPVELTWLDEPKRSDRERRIVQTEKGQK